MNWTDLQPRPVPRIRLTLQKLILNSDLTDWQKLDATSDSDQFAEINDWTNESGWVFFNNKLWGFDLHGTEATQSGLARYSGPPCTNESDWQKRMPSRLTLLKRFWTNESDWLQKRILNNDSDWLAETEAWIHGNYWLAETDSRINDSDWHKRIKESDLGRRFWIDYEYLSRYCDKEIDNPWILWLTGDACDKETDHTRCQMRRWNRFWKLVTCWNREEIVAILTVADIVQSPPAKANHLIVCLKLVKVLLSILQTHHGRLFIEVGQDLEVPWALNSIFVPVFLSV